MDAVEKFEVGKFTVKIYQDEDAESPRDWDNLGKMVCAHRRYNLGDEQMDPEEIREITERSDVFWLPLYLYDHSGLTMSTARNYPFNDPWDSGQVGIIYVEKEAIKKEWKVKRISPKLRATVFNNLVCEVETYDQYLRGDVYGYVVEDHDGEHLDSCWGFFGSDHVEQEGRAMAEYYQGEMLKGVKNSVICVGMKQAA